MADIRINSLPTTASASSSDDFLALDGATNGTRKLNAFSPTFGGNLTVSGTGTQAFSGAIQTTGGIGTTTASSAILDYSSGARVIARGASAGAYGVVKIAGTDSAGSAAITGGLVATFDSSNGATTLAGNLTVSGTGVNTFNVGAGTSVISLNSTAASPTWISMTSGATTLASIARTGNDLIISGGNSGAALTLTYGATQTATITGNLTVSGTGQSINVPFAADTAILANYDNTYRNGVRFNSSSRETSVFAAGGTGDGGIITFLTRATNGSSSTDFGTERARITSNGNFLLGTTTDSGNGKVQLATHTTSAGGIGFGTDTSLFRAASGNLCLNDSGTNAALSFYNAGTLRGYVFAQGSTTKFILGSLTAGWSTEIQSGNGTTALTLDSSQRAQFASLVGIGVAPSTGIYVNLNADPGTLTYTNANSWIGYRASPERAGTTGVGYGIVSQLRVASGTQTYGVGLISEAPGGSGTVTNFQAIRIGGRDLITGNYAIYDNSGYDTWLGGTLITQAGTASTPASASATGTAGMIKWDASYIYVCTAANTWKRVAIATWP